MVTLTVRTSLAILTVSVIIMVVVATGYMDKDMASAFDVWWKPFAIGMGIAVFPLVALVMIENKAHEKIVKMLPPISRNTIPFNKREVDDDDDAKPRERSESEELSERLRGLGPLPPRSVTGGGGGEEGEGEGEEDTSGVEAAKKAAKEFGEKLDKALKKDLADIEKERKKAEKDIDNQLSGIQDEREKAIEETDKAIKDLENEYEAKISAVEAAQKKFAKQIKDITEANEAAAKATKEFSLENMKKKGEISAKDLENAVAAFRRARPGRLDPLKGGPTFDDPKKYREAMMKFSEDLKKYIEDYKEAYQKAELVERDRLMRETTKTTNKMTVREKADQWWNSLLDEERKRYREVEYPALSNVDEVKFSAYTERTKDRGNARTETTEANKKLVDELIKQWKFQWTAAPPKEPQFQPKGPPPNAGESVDDLKDELERKKQDLLDQQKGKLGDLDKKADGLSKQKKNINKNASQQSKAKRDEASRAKTDANQKASEVKATRKKNEEGTVFA